MPTPPRPPRPERRWRTLAIAASIAAALLIAAWAASMRWQFGYHRSGPGAGMVLTTLQRGAVWVTGDPSVTSPSSFWSSAAATPSPLRWWPGRRTYPGGMWDANLPLWIPTAFSLLAAAAFWRIDAIHRRRLRTGICPACSYDRTGLPTAAPCPECGASPAPAAAAPPKLPPPA